MPTLVRDPQPVEFARLLERRRALGQDLLDEVWRRVRDESAPAEGRADIAQQLAELLGPAALVIEIVSPGDDTWKKVPF
jgi:hypothetical protein